MKSLLYHAFGIKATGIVGPGMKGEIIFSWSPKSRRGRRLMRRGFRWRDVRTVATGLKPVVLRVKGPRWLNTTTGEEFEQKEDW